MKPYRTLLIALLVMSLLAPIGLYLPQILKVGSAWGEWGIEEVRRMVGYAPAGMEKTAERWRAPIPGYAPPGREDASSPALGFYLLSAFLGAAACGAGAWLLARRLARRGGNAGNGGSAGAS